MTAAAKTALVADLSRQLAEMLRPVEKVVLPAKLSPLSELSGFPERLYYTGPLAVPAPRQPLDCTRPLTRLDREALAIAHEADRRRVRFFAGRWSRRLGRIVRPR